MQSLYTQVLFLSQIKLNNLPDGVKVAKRLLDIYFALFKVMYGTLMFQAVDFTFDYLYNAEF